MGSSSKPQTTTQVFDYPDWLEGSWRSNIDLANQLANQGLADGYQPYTGERIAPFNTYQQQAFANIGANQGMWQPHLQASSDFLSQSNSTIGSALQNAQANAFINPAYAGPGTMAQIQNAGPGAQVQAGTLPGMNLAGYMDPFQSAVTDNALGKIEQQRQQQNLANADAATKARAFGGSRHGVVEAQTNAAFAKQGADTALQSAQSNFLNAQSQAQTDLARNLQAQLANQGSLNSMSQFNAGLASDTGRFNAQTANDMAQFNAGLAQQGAMFNAGNAGNLANMQLSAADQYRQNAGASSSLGSLMQQLWANDNNNLMNAGNQLQDQQQAIDDLGYQEWLAGREHPWDMLNRRVAAVSGVNYEPGRSMTTPLYRNRGNSFLGGASAGYGMFNDPDNPNSNAGYWGALVGGLLGAFG